jgi:hypothetical protein
MLNKTISWPTFCGAFESRTICSDEIEKLIKAAIKDEYPGRLVVKLSYEEGGVLVELDNGEKIEIEIDWQEIIMV